MKDSISIESKNKKARAVLFLHYKKKKLKHYSINCTYYTGDYALSGTGWEPVKTLSMDDLISKLREEAFFFFSNFHKTGLTTTAQIEARNNILFQLKPTLFGYDNLIIH